MNVSRHDTLGTARTLIDEASETPGWNRVYPDKRFALKKNGNGGEWIDKYDNRPAV